MCNCEAICRRIPISSGPKRVTACRRSISIRSGMASNSQARCKPCWRNCNEVGADADASKLGDAFLLEHRFENVTASELVRLFGTNFETALRALPTNEWQGPVPSGYGVHLVFVDKRDDGRAAALEDVRDEVRREWIHDQRQQANERFYADLRKRYEVTVERPTASGGASALAAGMRQ